MPSITARICGICPVSHLLASAKACDAIMAVRIPETARQAARAGPLRAVRAVARAQLLPSLRARPAAGLRFRPGAPQRVRPDRRATRRWPATASRCASSGSRSSRDWPRSASIPRGSCPAASTRRSPPRCATAFWPGCPDARAIAETHAGVLQEHARPLPRRDRELRHRAHAVRRAGGRRRRPAAGTTAGCSSRTPDGNIVADGIRARDYAALHRRSVAARFLSESALLQAARLSRRVSTAWDRWRGFNVAERLRHAARRRANWPSSASASARVVAQLVSLPLRAPHRAAARRWRRSSCCWTIRRSSTRTCAPTPA